MGPWERRRLRRAAARGLRPLDTAEMTIAAGSISGVPPSRIQSWVLLTLRTDGTLTSTVGPGLDKRLVLAMLSRAGADFMTSWPS